MVAKPLILTVGRQISELEVSMVYIASTRPAKGTKWDRVSKAKQNNEILTIKLHTHLQRLLFLISYLVWSIYLFYFVLRQGLVMVHSGTELSVSQMLELQVWTTCLVKKILFFLNGEMFPLTSQQPLCKILGVYMWER